MTRKPLQDMIPELLAHFDKYQDQLEFNRRLHDYDEGQISNEIKIALRQEMVSTSAYKRAIQRIPSINLVRKVKDKLSKVYHQPAQRSTGDSSDQKLMDKLSTVMSVDKALLYSDQATNLYNCSAIEIFQDKGVQNLRILGGHQFLVYSDNPINPLEPTVFIKLMGKDYISAAPAFNSLGEKIDNSDQIREVELLGLYTDNEFMIIDSSGRLRTDKMAEMGATSTQNPFGIIPFVYINKSYSKLVPFPNKSTFDIGILIPKLLTDLNYSAQFLSHSVIYTKNVDLAGAEINPDAIVNLGDSSELGEPEIGTIKPETDIEGILRLVEFQLSSYLTSVGVKAGAIGQLMPGREVSGVSKIMDESDATEAVMAQSERYKVIERVLWYKISKIQEYWSRAGIVDEKRTFSSKFLEDFSVKFHMMKPLESENDKYNRIKIGRELKLMTKRQALRELYPMLDEDQIGLRLGEIEDELKEEKEEMMSIGLTPGFTQKAQALDTQSQTFGGQDGSESE